MPGTTTDKAVILSAGLGTRMQKTDPDSGLTGKQSEVAQTGVKGMIPIGRPFLDYVLHAVADGGFRRICLVIGPDHHSIRKYYEETLTCSRITIEFAVQEKPLGTADALRAATGFAAGDPFVAMNADNYYPAETLAALREVDGSGLIAYDREGLLDGGNIPADRIARFAIVETDEQGCLTRIVEKPDPEVLAQQSGPIGVSMNCWRFEESIFEACDAIEPSERGELEIPDAVQYSIDRLGVRFRAVPFSAPVLDLTHRTDIAGVAEKLADHPVDL